MDLSLREAMERIGADDGLFKSPVMAIPEGLEPSTS